jgi:hypothetical protein
MYTPEGTKESSYCSTCEIISAQVRIHLLVWIPQTGPRQKGELSIVYLSVIDCVSIGDIRNGKRPPHWHPQ